MLHRIEARHFVLDQLHGNRNGNERENRTWANEMPGFSRVHL